MPVELIPERFVGVEVERPLPRFPMKGAVRAVPQRQLDQPPTVRLSMGWEGVSFRPSTRSLSKVSGDPGILVRV